MRRTSAVLLAILALALIWVFWGCETSDNLPTSASNQTPASSNSLGSENVYIWPKSNYDFAGFNPNACNDPALLFAYYEWLHLDVMKWVLDRCPTVSDIMILAPQMPGPYFGLDIPSHDGWSLDSLTLATANTETLTKWCITCVDQGLISQSFADYLRNNMDQLLAVINNPFNPACQNNYQSSDLLINNVRANYANFQPLELVISAVMASSYEYAKVNDFLVFHADKPPGVGMDSGWTILGDLLGGLGGLGLTKTPQDAMGGSAIGSAAVDLIERALQ